jgi:hypothetical protein
MPDLIVRFKKKSDGSAALSCTRADGTVSWQRQEGQLAQFFPLHDMTHLAVESVLGLRRSFYGLVAEGWDITGFALPGFRERLTDEALFAELIVGFFDLERQMSERLTAADFNDKAAAYCADHERPAPPVRLTPEQVDEIRVVRDNYFAHWRAAQAGDVLEMAFERGGGPAVIAQPAAATQTGGRRVG